jgi:hypothetical protein
MNERPQDVGRSHTKRRRGEADPLLTRWQKVERDTLSRVVDELEGRDTGTGLDGSQLPREYPSTAATAALIDLGVKIARDLGSAIEPAPVPEAAPSRPKVLRSRKLDL